MDVRIKFGLSAVAREPDQEILTGLRDGTLRSLFDTLLNRHPELSAAVQEGHLDLELMRVLVNDKPLTDASLGSYHLKDGDTVSVFLRDGAGKSTSS